MLLYIADPKTRVHVLKFVWNEYYGKNLLFFVAPLPQWTKASTLSRFDRSQTRHSGYYFSDQHVAKTST